MSQKRLRSQNVATLRDPSRFTQGSILVASGWLNNVRPFSAQSDTFGSSIQPACPINFAPGWTLETPAQSPIAMGDDFPESHIPESCDYAWRQHDSNHCPSQTFVLQKKGGAVAPPFCSRVQLSLERVSPVEHDIDPVAAFTVSTSRSGGNIGRVANPEIMRGLVGSIA